MNKQTVKYILLIGKIVITALFVIVVNRSIPKDQANIAELIPLHLLFPVVLLSAISTTFQAFRWYLFLNLFGLKPTIGQSFRSYLEGVLFGIITPGRAGELFRGFTLEPQWRKTASVAVITEKISGTIVLFVFGAIAWTLLPGNRGGSLYETGLAIAATLSLIAIPVIPFLIKQFYPTSIEVTRRFMMTFLLSVPIHLILLLQTMFLLSSRIDLPIHSSSAIAASAFSAMQFIPVTVANLGVREFCLNLFTKLFAAPHFPEQTIHFTILSTSLIIVIANLLLPAIPGMFLVLRSKLSSSERRT